MPYDYDSVMHYGPYAFSKNGLKTIEPKVSQLTIYSSYPFVGCRQDLWFFNIAKRLNKTKNNKERQATASQCKGFSLSGVYGG